MLFVDYSMMPLSSTSSKQPKSQNGLENEGVPSGLPDPLSTAISSLNHQEGGLGWTEPWRWPTMTVGWPLSNKWWRQLFQIRTTFILQRTLVSWPTSLRWSQLSFLFDLMAWLLYFQWFHLSSLFLYRTYSLCFGNRNQRKLSSIANFQGRGSPCMKKPDEIAQDGRNGCTFRLLMPWPFFSSHL